MGTKMIGGFCVTSVTRKLNLVKLCPLRNVITCRFWSTTVHNSPTSSPTSVTSIQPIDMAYSSYESTNKQLTANKEEVLIIMHGLMGSKSNWNTLSKVLHSKTFWKVIAVDARNHGDSPHTPEHTYPHLVEDIKALMENLKIQKASFIGHSMGGRAMMLMALKYPELVDKLVVVDISPIGASPQLMHMIKYFDAMKSIRLTPNIPLSVARKMADQQLAATISDKSLRDFLIMNLVEVEGGLYRWRINLEALSNNFAAAIANFPTVNTTFTGPTLFIGGSRSDYLRSEEYDDIRKIFPAAEFIMVDGAGHLVHVEKPADFLFHTTEFLLHDQSK